MNIKLHEILVKDLVENYTNSDEEGVVGYIQKNIFEVYWKLELLITNYILIFAMSLILVSIWLLNLENKKELKKMIDRIIKAFFLAVLAMTFII